MIKRVFVKSAMCKGETEARFLDDKEWKIVLKCGDLGESRGESSGELSGELSGDSSDSGVDSGDSSTDSQITITFFALENDIDCLARGYLATFLGFDFANLKRENNSIFVDSPLSKDEILTRLSQKDIIQSCEQISLNDKKIMRDSLIMPFNGSRAKITIEILEANCEFFQNGESGESSEFPHKARILLGESYESNAESFDTNPKNAIYKAIGKAFDFSAQSKQITSLLDCVIFLNFRIDIESLKILLLQKCTFIVCAGIPSFSVVRFAQKFGITLMAFIPSKNGDLSQNADLQKDSHDFLILTHALRFQA